MNCQEINYILDANARGELRVDQKQAIDLHFASCGACREAWAAYGEVSALRIPRTPQDLRSRIAAALAPTEAHAMRRSLILGSVLVVGAAVAAAVAFRVVNGTPGHARRHEEPTLVAAPVAPARQEPAPVSANRAEDAVGADTLNEPSDSTSSRTTYSLDPNSIVVLPVQGRELDPRRATLFTQFYEELLRQLRSVPGLNVVPPERVHPFLSSVTPEEEIARELGAAHAFVLSTASEPPGTLIIVQVDAATGAETGNMAIYPHPGASGPAVLSSDVPSVVEFIEQGLTVFTPADLPAAIANAHAIILNAALPPIERVQALEMAPVPEAWPDAVVAAAVQLATSAPALRQSIWRAIQGVDNPYLIEPLLDSLAYDADDYARRAAADALRTFVAEPRVKAALERAQASDASPGVREAAQRALLTDEERDQLALQTLFDETLPARQRLLSLDTLTGRSIRPVPLTDEAARAVFDIGAGSTDPEVRGMAWSKLGREHVYNPSFMNLLLDDLANHPSDSVRSAAVRALEPAADDTAVRAALEQAEHDASFEVRYAARSALGQIPRKPH